MVLCEKQWNESKNDSGAVKAWIHQRMVEMSSKERTTNVDSIQ